MGPVSQHLCTLFPELPQPCADSKVHWSFDEDLTALPHTFYNKVLPLHPILNVEYSVLCNQLRQDFLDPKIENKEQIIERLSSALLLCELLEHVHLNYLVVPREVLRLRQQQALFRSLLCDLAGYTFATDLAQKRRVMVNLSLSQQIRETTMQINWYRICVNRSKRVADVLNTVVTDSPGFNSFMIYIGQYGNPFLAYFGLLFHLPRLLTNSFLLLKHTVAGSWMAEDERALAWTTRLQCQIQRRWFEMGNDLVWTAVSAINLFVLVGALAGGAVYLSAAAFAFDMIHAATRAFIELRRLYTLRADYTDMLAKEQNPEKQESIRAYLQHLEERIRFEQYRFTLHVTGNTLIFLAMGMALPVFALNPVVVLASAIFLLLLWGITYALTQKLDNYRPKEAIENTDASVSKLGLFAPKRTRAKEEEPQYGESETLERESLTDRADIDVDGLLAIPPSYS